LIEKYEVITTIIPLTVICSSQHNTDIALKKSLIEKKLEESGEKARLEEYLRQKLIECGWKDELKKYCLGRFQETFYFRPIYHFTLMEETHSYFYRFDKIKGT
jgi:hypothetical protein